jgi:hypothetical protein
VDMVELGIALFYVNRLLFFKVFLGLQKNCDVTTMRSHTFFPQQPFPLFFTSCVSGTFVIVNETISKY